MEIDHLKEFVALASIEHFQEAANELFIAQSTLSKHIKHIEQELGITLFERNTRTVKLSTQGQAFLPIAEQISDLYTSYLVSLQNTNANEKEVLMIGAIPALAPYKITEIVARYKKQFLRSQLKIIQSGTNELKKMLLEGECELAFLRETTFDDERYTRINYATDSIVAVLSIDHPLAKQQSLSVSQLKHDPFLFIEKNTWLYHLCLQFCTDNGFDPEISFTDHRVENLLDLVGNGVGVALLMEQLATYYATANTVLVKIEPTIETYLSLSYRKGKKLSKAALNFIKCMNFLKSQISSDIH